MAREIFYKQVEIELISTEEEDLGVDQKQQHSIFHLKIYNEGRLTPPQSPTCPEISDCDGDQTRTVDTLACSDKTTNIGHASNGVSHSDINQTKTLTPSTIVTHISSDLSDDSTNDKNSFPLSHKTNGVSSGHSEKISHSKDTRHQPKKDRVRISRGSNSGTSSIHARQTNVRRSHSKPDKEAGLHSSSHVDPTSPTPITSTEPSSLHSPTYGKDRLAAKLLNSSSSMMCPFGPFPASHGQNGNSSTRNGHLSTSHSGSSLPSSPSCHQKESLVSQRTHQAAVGDSTGVHRSQHSPSSNKGTYSVSALNDLNSKPNTTKTSGRPTGARLGKTGRSAENGGADLPT